VLTGIEIGNMLQLMARSILSYDCATLTVMSHRWARPVRH